VLSAFVDGFFSASGENVNKTGTQYDQNFFILGVVPSHFDSKSSAEAGGRLLYSVIYVVRFVLTKSIYDYVCMYCVVALH
jgi:hypothetical protein